MTELILMRHGKTDATKRHIYCGLADLPLADDAYEEIRQTVAQLPVFTYVYASDLRRARQTADIAAPQAEVRPRPTLREIDFGSFDGLTADEIMARMPKMWDTYMRDVIAFTFPGGDNVRAFAACAAAEARSIAAAHNGQKVLVVTHKGVILSILSMLLHGDASRMFCYDVRPAGFACLYVDGEAAVLKQLC